MQDFFLTEQEISTLDDLLHKYINFDSDDDTGIYDVEMLEGYLTAIVSGPHMVMPSVWMPAIWGSEGYTPNWQSEQEYMEFTALAIKMMNGITDVLITLPEAFIPLFNQLDYSEANCPEVAFDDAIGGWCMGYAQGITVGGNWHNTPEIIGDIKMLDVEAQPADIDIPTLAKFVPKAVRRIHAYWLDKRSDGQVIRAIKQPIKAEPKVGCNDPCICGSGKKFKQCCLH